MPPDYENTHDKDAQFMKESIESIKSRLCVLKRQAAAGWNHRFTRMLDQCHSIAVEPVSVEEKEAVRTRKLKCMACGRSEHCCKYALHAIGCFNQHGFNEQGVGHLFKNWSSFIESYNEFNSNYVNNTKKYKLPYQDMGQYTIGTTCLRKAELYHMANVMVMECCYDAKVDVDSKMSQEHLQMRWYHANENNALAFMKKMRGLELAIADEKSAVPKWGVDESLWCCIEESRTMASFTHEPTRMKLLRQRAEHVLHQFEQPGMRVYSPSMHEESDGGSETRSENENHENHDDVSVGTNQSDDENDDNQPKRNKGSKTYRVVYSDDEENGQEESAESAASVVSLESLEVGSGKKRKRTKDTPSCTRMALRSQSKIGSTSEHGMGEEALWAMPFNEGEEEEEEDEEVEEEVEEVEEEVEEVEELEDEGNALRARAPQPNALNMAQQQRRRQRLVSHGRLPSRQSALISLGILQVRLLRQARLDDAAICTNAMFVIQELMSRVSELQHSVET